MGVGTPIARFPNARRIYSGQFTGADGVITAGTTNFKGDLTVARTGEGVYLFTFQDGKGRRLASMDPTIINPAVADGGSGRIVVTTDSMLTAGTLSVTTFNQGNAAADIIGVAKFEFAVEAS